MSFASFRDSESSFSRSEIIIFAKQNHHFREAELSFPPNGRNRLNFTQKTEYPIRGCRAAEMTIWVKPFEPDTGNTGEGSLKSTEFFRGCRTFTAGMCGSFVFREN